MSVFAFVLGVLFMATGVAASIALHEVGHLVPAKRFGVRVTQYMVGFGPTMWSRRRGETEYGVKAVPLGGYIRMIGMFPPRPGDAPGTVRVSSTGRFSQLVDEARAASLEEVRPGDENRVFYRLSVPKKVIVMLGGPTMNLLIGVVLLTLLVTVHGVATAQPGAVVATVSQCVMPVTEHRRHDGLHRPAEVPGTAGRGCSPATGSCRSPAEPIDDNRDVSALIRPQVDQPVPIVLERDGKQLTVTVTPTRNVVPVLDADGLPVMNADGTPQTTEAGYLGVRSVAPVAYVPQSPTAVPGILWSFVSGTAEAIVHVPERMVGVWQAAFGGAEREADSPMSVVGVGRVAGEATGGKYDSLVGRSAGRQGVVPRGAARGAQLHALRLQPDPACSRSTAATSPGRSGRGSSARSPSCAAGPTRGTSTSPRPCRSPTRSRWCCSVPRCC